MIARFVGGPMDGRLQELPINPDGMPPAEIPCEVHAAELRAIPGPWTDQLVPTRTLLYVRTVNPLDEGPLVIYLAADPTDWDSESAGV